MPTDALLSLQPLTTKSSTFTGSTLILPTGTPKRGENIRIIYSAASNASGSNTVIWSLQVSRDGGTTFYTEFQTDPITLSTTVLAGTTSIPFAISPSSVANGTQIQLVCTIAGSGTSPTVTYQGDILLK